MSSSTPTSPPTLDWSKRQRSVYWSGPPSQDGCVMMIDQRDLPNRFDILPHQTLQSIIHSIKIMLVRGAPAIGAAGGFGMVVAAFASPSQSLSGLINDLKQAKQQLDDARPTAVNLSWATNRIYELAVKLYEHHQQANTQLSTENEQKFIEKLKLSLYHESQTLADEDVKINKRLADYGADLIKENANVLHHCNTGCLATVDYGTALGVIYSLHHQGKNVHVWVDETRPRLQGARLTAWELMREGVPMHLIPDNANGLLMYNGKVDAFVFGADRVAQNGDTANKIGTYKTAVVARENNVPVYACVPTSTIDLTVVNGKDIPIEERGAEEVTHVGKENIAPINCPVFNPAFDVTPAKYITAIITEEGVCYPPFQQSLKQVKEKAEQRIREEWKNRLQTYLQGSE